MLLRNKRFIYESKFLFPLLSWKEKNSNQKIDKHIKISKSESIPTITFCKRMVNEDIISHIHG